MVKNPPSNAGDVGLILGRGTRIPHAVGQLSPFPATKAPRSQINTYFYKWKRKEKGGSGGSGGEQALRFLPALHPGQEPQEGDPLRLPFQQ